MENTVLTKDGQINCINCTCLTFKKQSIKETMRLKLYLLKVYTTLILLSRNRRLMQRTHVSLLHLWKRQERDMTVLY